MFGKLKAKTAEDVLNIFKELSEEEKAKVLSAINPPETEDEAQTDEAEERGEEDGTKDKTEKDVEDESVGEQEHLDGNENFQPAEERIDESEGEASEEPEVKNDSKDRYKALTARIEALEATLNDIRQYQADEVEKERDKDFGMTPSVPEGEEEDSRYKRVMRGYAKNNSNQYL